MSVLDDVLSVGLVWLHTVLSPADFTVSSAESAQGNPRGTVSQYLVVAVVAVADVTVEVVVAAVADVAVFVADVVAVLAV